MCSSDLEHLYLVGYRGCGKSTIGSLLSEKLALPWVDTDRLIEAAVQMPATDYFHRFGEPSFRRIEQQVIAQCDLLPAHVISLGGGAILAEENRKQIRATGRTVWLQCSIEELASRLAGDQKEQGKGRPSLTGKGVVTEIEEVLKKREPLYREVADLIVASDRLQPFEVVEQIAGWLTRDRAREEGD